MQAVQFLLASRERLNSQNSNGEAEETTLQQVDPIQVSCYLSITDSSCLSSQKLKGGKKKEKEKKMRILNIAKNANSRAICL